MGKTALSLNIALHNALPEKESGFFFFGDVQRGGVDEASLLLVPDQSIANL